MGYVVYILFSTKLGKYYVGHTENIEKRIADHNGGLSNYTSKGIPWELVHYFECENKLEAIRLELRVKKRGIKRYLQDRNVL